MSETTGATGEQRQFAHLHLHSSYSLVDGLMQPEQLAAVAKERNLSAVALTDRGNLFGFLQFYRAMRAQGVKPICGVEIPVQTAAGHLADLVLLVRNEEGYRNLMRLVSRGYTDDSFTSAAHLQRDWLRGCTAGLTALSGGHRGEVGALLAAGDTAAAQRSLDELRRLFDGEFMLEISRLGWEDEGRCLERSVELAAQMDCPLVACNNVRFLNREDFEAHEARVCIARGDLLNDNNRRRDYLQTQFLADAEQMHQIFADLPEAVENANTLARRCNLTLDFGHTHMPHALVPKGQSEIECMRELALQGLKKQLGDVAELPEDYLQRLNYEIEVIERTGFAGYFLVVSEFVNWGKDNGVIVGPGRGSGAGALVSWALGITDLDPLKYGLLFERFLNPERLSPPDLDIDFDPKGRGRVIEHVVELYGRDAVAQIATMDFAKARGAIRDAARVLGYSPGLAHTMCEQFPRDQQQLTVVEAEEQLSSLREMAEGEDVRAILDLAAQMEGQPRNASRHAGGIVIAPGVLTDHAPVFRTDKSDDWVATQYDMKGLEDVGLVKFDFLGLTTLTIIDDAVANVNELKRAAGEAEISVADMALDDPAAYAILERGETEGVFQLESPQMRGRIQRFAAQNFDELMALLALIRPGTLQAGMFDTATQCKSGAAEKKPPHPLLAEVVDDTWGVMIYQEQVMEAARHLAGYSYGSADDLRKAMGKKDSERMEHNRAIFTKGAVSNKEHEITPKEASHVFDLIAQFADYGFNKSHSAAYAVLSLQTAWLKAHYPACFMAAALTQEMHQDRRWQLVRACRRLNLRVLPPDVNASKAEFSVAGSDGSKDNIVRFGLLSINGMGEAPATAIVQARDAGGAFADLYDFCLRCRIHEHDVSVLQALNNAGALRSLEPNQSRAAAMLQDLRIYAEKRTREKDTGQADLFGDSGGEASPSPLQSSSSPPPGQISADGPQLTAGELAQRERQALGMWLLHHPLRPRRQSLQHLWPKRVGDLEKAEVEGPMDVVARVHSLNQRRQNDQRLWFLTLDDEADRCTVEVQESLYEKYREQLRADQLLQVEVEVWPAKGNRYRPRRQLRQLWELQDVLRARVKRLVVDLQGDLSDEIWGRVKELHRPDGCPLVVRCRQNGLSGEVELSAAHNLVPDEVTLLAFQSMFGVENVHLEYN